MKICIFGAGAIGGYVAAELCRAGHAEISVVARGPHLEAIRSNGLVLRKGGGEHRTFPRATDNPKELGAQDYVIIAVKSHSLPTVIEGIEQLLGDHTHVVPAVNGIPYWYFYKLDGPFEGRHLDSVDPYGMLWKRIGPERALGCVVYPAAEVTKPGVIEHVSGNRFALGEPDGSKSDRCTALSELFQEAGMRAPVRSRLRDEIWIKLWGNCSLNPVSALTNATLDRMLAHPGTRHLIREVMGEAQTVGEKLGVRFAVDVDKRIKGAEDVGAHKTSMLQDMERGRPMEVDPMVTAVGEMGELVGVETPVLDRVLSLVHLSATLAGLYPYNERGAAAYLERRHRVA